MNGVLNEVTNTVHKREIGAEDDRTVCGATLHVSHDRIRSTTVDTVVSNTCASKCGRCFDDGGGY